MRMLMTANFFVSTEDSILECFRVLDSFEKSSGAKVNKNKHMGFISVLGETKYPNVMK